MTQLIGRLPSVEGANDKEYDELQLLELQLIATQSTHHQRLRCKETYPRKRKGPFSLMTLWAARGLLDEGPNAATRKLLAGIHARWNFNAFSLDRLTSGQNLATLCTYLFRDQGLLGHFRLDALVVWRFFAVVGRCFRHGFSLGFVGLISSLSSSIRTEEISFPIPANSLDLNIWFEKTCDWLNFQIIIYF